MKTSEILARAAEYIETHGWQQEGYGRSGGPRCVTGALWSVGDGTSVFTEAQEQLARCYFPGRWASAEVWNDARGRTQDQVVSALLGASLVAMAAGE